MPELDLLGDPVPGPSPWRIWEVNDVYEWVIARTKDEAIQIALKTWGYEPRDLDVAIAERLIFPEEVHALSDAAMQRLHIRDDDGTEKGGERRTFAEALARRVAEGLSAPEYFASSEC